MGKAARNQAKRGNRKIGLPGFPYEREFSQAELEVIFARWERIKETLRDAIGPQGWGLGMNEDFLQQIALHQALAGVDADPGYPAFDEATRTGAFIRPVRNPDGLHVDSIKWVLTKKDKPGDRARDAKREAKARFELLRQQAMRGADPDVREAMRELMLEGAEWAEEQLHDTADADEPDAKFARGEHQQ